MASRKKKSSIKSLVLTAAIAAAASVLVFMAAKAGLIDIDILNKMIGNGTISSADGELEVMFIDVGQGDCSLITSEDRAILIDTGEPRVVGPHGERGHQGQRQQHNISKSSHHHVI